LATPPRKHRARSNGSEPQSHANQSRRTSEVGASKIRWQMIDAGGQHRTRRQRPEPQNLRGRNLKSQNYKAAEVRG